MTDNDLRIVFESMMPHTQYYLKGVCICCSEALDGEIYWTVRSSYFHWVVNAVEHFNANCSEKYFPIMNPGKNAHISDVLSGAYDVQHTLESLLDLLNWVMNHPDSYGILQDFFNDYTIIRLDNPVDILHVCLMLLDVDYCGLFADGIFSLDLRNMHENTFAILNYMLHHTGKQLQMGTRFQTIGYFHLTEAVA